MLHRFAAQTVTASAASLLLAVAMAEGPAAPVPLAVVGPPLPTTVIGDAKHCPTNLAPTAKPSAARTEFNLRAGEPASITLSERRGGHLCGGSLYLVPEAGLGYAARLTPGDWCAAQLFRIDAHAQPPVQLMRTDDHADLNELLCAQQNAPASSRLAVGRNAHLANVRVEVGADGLCGKFVPVSQSGSGNQIESGVKQWIRLHFRTLATTVDNGTTRDILSICDVAFAFTPTRGTAYFLDSNRGLDICKAQLLEADAQGAVVVAQTEPANESACGPAH